MKQTLIIFISILLITFLANGCKKDSTDDEGPKITKEEFINVPNLTSTGWVFVNNSSPSGVAAWQQGQYGVDKYGLEYGFPAYSYKGDKKHEYAFAGAIYASNFNMSSWLISPVYEIKNGDKISFYTRAVSKVLGEFIDRLQVRMNGVDNTADVGNTPGSVGKFTVVLKDINETMTVGGYPLTWTKYEITVSGLSSSLQTRIAFRYMPDANKANGIGIDLFQLTNY